MPSLAENRQVWSHYDWQRQGEEWSATWGGVQAQWWGCLFPRLYRFLPARTVLEIAPGAGRFSQFLAALSERLILVDLVPGCVEACRARFSGLDHVECHVNDGRSLPFVDGRSVDFAFSFDSLVHVDMSTLAAYLGELARVLSVDGVAFLHHSNFGVFVDPATGVAAIPNSHWRDPGVTAEKIRSAAAAAGLATLVQEIVNWGGEQLTDCLSLLTPRGSRHESPLRRVENAGFMDEARRLAQVAALWDPGESEVARISD